MEFTSIPIIVLCSYILGEIYKAIFVNVQRAYKLIPVVVSIFGGIIGVLIYFTNPEIMFNVDNIWSAIGIGIVSGTSSTGTNQMIKQIFNDNADKN